MLKLGSLFDGSGGWPLAAKMCGIKPVWSSEIEKFPCQVAHKNFPDMINHGDVTKVCGDKVEPVDIITSGSPCFVKDTLITTDHGLIPIQKVRVGDMVLTHELRYRKVTELFVSNNITYLFRCLDGHITECTSNHPFYVHEFDNTYSWIKASDMEPYQSHVCVPFVRRDMTWCMVYDLFIGLRENGLHEVFNLEVEEDHSYVADGMIVHNCQDLSVAGKRAGLSGNRSSLFMDSIRIVKEMREKTNGTYPKYFVWENVFGAFSSNEGEDFRIVLDTIAKVKEPTASVPRPKKWEHSGLVVGNGWSVGWRGLDAEYWGVPQRRKRIFLVADFTGGSAGEILFERKGLSGNFEKSNEKGQTDSCDVKERIGESGAGVDTVYCIQGNSIGRKDENGCGGRGWREGQSYTLNTIDRPAVVAFKKKTHPKSKDDPQLWEEAKVNDTLNTFDQGESRTPTIILDNHATDSRLTVAKGGVCPTLSARMGTGGMNTPLALEQPVCIGNGQLAQLKESKVCGTLNCMHDQIAVMEPYTTGTEQLASGEDHTGIIMSQCYKGFTGDQEAFSGDYYLVNNIKKTIRRLTPLECCRLQGFPDDWCSGVKHGDSVEYKMWGNGMALPCALYIMEGIVTQETK